MAIRTFVGTLKNRYSQYKQLNNMVAVIENSGKFDERYYLTNHSIQDKWAVKSPIKHFLTKGATLGYNPSEWFNTSWYVEHYEDVKEQGVNPFFHYILYGRREGRKPSPNRFATALDKKRDWIKNGVVENLWGGYSEPALQDLQTVYQSHEEDTDLRYFAAWHAARWFYFEDDFKKALSLSELVRELSKDYHIDKTAVLMHAFCLIKLGDLDEAKVHLLEYLETSPSDADVLLSLSNLHENPQNRLFWINSAFERHGFAPIALNEFKGQIGFENLVATAPPIQDDRLVSVIIPTFNAGERIEIAIRSLLNQSWRNLEVIVVDDCSIDDTTERVRRIMLEDERIKLVQQPHNGGAYKARNAGLKVAEGDFITTHDGDDWSHPQKIETQVSYLDKHSTVMGVSTFWIRATSDLHFQHNWRLNPRLIHWSHSSFLFRRQVLDELGPWDNVIAGGDTEFIWRVQAHYGKWAFKRIHKEVPMAFALDDDGSLTRNKATHIKTMHNGLRHVYRSACSWWHRQQASNLNITELRSRPFPAPRSMLVRGDNNAAAELIFISDFSTGRFNDDDFSLIASLLEKGKQVMLYHIPVYGKVSSPLCDKFFTLLQKENSEVCVYGMQVSVAKVVFLNSHLLRFVPEQLAEVRGDFTFVQQIDEYIASSENIERFVSMSSKKDVIHLNRDSLKDELLA